MIGVFDSGLGGLLVLNDLAKDYPKQQFLFHPDRKNAPFGNRSDDELQAIFKENLTYFKKRGCQDLLVACNTLCSTIDFSTYTDIRIHDIIEKTVNTVDVDNHAHILLLATAKTIEKGRYERLLKARGYNNITALALPLLATLIEEYAGEETVYDYLKLMFKDIKDVDAVILGCTHYPAVKEQIKAFFPVKIFDSNNLQYSFLSNDKKGAVYLDLPKDEGLLHFLDHHLDISYQFK